MAITFVRTSELINARWSEFDFEAAQWRITAELMRMETPHIVPLSRQAIHILETLKSISGDCELVFPNQNNRTKPMSNNTILKALAIMGYKGKMTGHGFRGIASIALHEQVMTICTLSYSLHIKNVTKPARPTTMHYISNNAPP